jgi:hypothetical protein
VTSCPHLATALPSPAPAPAKCPYNHSTGAIAVDTTTDLNNVVEEAPPDGTCPFGFVSGPASTDSVEELYNLRAKLGSISDPLAFERRLIDSCCVFVTYDGEYLPW